MKELKLQKSQKVGPVGRKRKKYMYFDQLLFLMPTVENKRLVPPECCEREDRSYLNDALASL